MQAWLRRLRGVIGTGLTWGVGWGLVGVLIGVGLALGLPLQWFIDVFDAPLPALAVPGFFCGTVFSIVLGVAGRRRRFDELSLPRFAAWGALGGFLLGAGPVAVALNANTVSTLAAAVTMGFLSGLSAASAAGSLWLARGAEDHALLEASGDVAEVGLTEAEAKELLGNGG
jgi:hypothetical protein